MLCFKTSANIAKKNKENTILTAMFGNIAWKHSKQNERKCNFGWNIAVKIEFSLFFFAMFENIAAKILFSLFLFTMFADVLKQSIAEQNTETPTKYNFGCYVLKRSLKT